MLSFFFYLAKCKRLFSFNNLNNFLSLFFAVVLSFATISKKAFSLFVICAGWIFLITVLNSTRVFFRCVFKKPFFKFTLARKVQRMREENGVMCGFVCLCWKNDDVGYVSSNFFAFKFLYLYAAAIINWPENGRNFSHVVYNSSPFILH